MDYGRLVLQRWDQGAGRIGELKVYGPPPLSRMTEQLFGADGIYGPDIRARVEHRSSLDVYEARGGKLPRTRTGAARHRDPRRIGRRRRRMEAHRRPCPARPAVSGMPRVPARHRRGLGLLHRRQRPERHHRRARQGLRSADPHESLLQRHRAQPGLPRRVRQSSRQRDHREARRREDARPDAPARANRSPRDSRTDRPRDPPGVRWRGDLGRRSDAPHGAADGRSNRYEATLASARTSRTRHGIDERISTSNWIPAGADTTIGASSN